MEHRGTNTEQDWHAVAKFLKTRGHELNLDVDILKLSGGSANLNYKISMNGKAAVFRCPPTGTLPIGSNDIAREYKVLSHLGDAFPPAPRGLVYCDDVSIIGVPFCISEFREGACIGRFLPDTLKNHANIGDGLCTLLINTLIRLHKVDVNAVGLSSLGKLDGFLERQIGGWFKRGTQVLPEHQLEKLQIIRDWLNLNLPVNRPGALVHNDFKLDNMLVKAESLELAALVDWDMCTIGDPLYELMILMAYWGSANDQALYSYQCRMPHDSEGWWSRQKALSRYLSSQQFQVSESDLTFYWWLCQYRTVVVYAQLNKLLKRSGVSTSLTKDELEEMEPFIEDLLDHICEHLDSTPEFLRLKNTVS